LTIPKNQVSVDREESKLIHAVAIQITGRIRCVFITIHQSSGFQHDLDLGKKIGQFINLFVTIHQKKVAVWTGEYPVAAMWQRLIIFKGLPVRDYPIEKTEHGFFIENKQHVFIAYIIFVATQATAHITVQ
jgi:hypothetical protein